MNLSGKVILITGGTRGIGRSIAIELAKEGATLFLNYQNDDESAKYTMECINNMGGYAKIIKGDVSDYKFCQHMIQDAISKMGKIDIVVNNAAISSIGLFMDVNEEEFDRMMGVNFKSVYNVTHNVIPHMISRQKGNIINISSMWGNLGAACEVIYSASKGAINAFTKALAKEMALNNIRVNAVAPGVIATDMNRWMAIEDKEALEEDIPMGRFGSGEEVAKLICFLAKDDSSYITGQIINVDGGLQ